MPAYTVCLGREIQEWSCKWLQWCVDRKTREMRDSTVTAVLSVLEDNRWCTIVMGEVLILIYTGKRR